MNVEKEKKHKELYISGIALIISIVSMVVTFSRDMFDRELIKQKNYIEALKEMIDIQTDLEKIRAKIKGNNNLQQEEIWLLNYYEELAQLLAKNIDTDNKEIRMCCNGEPSVRLRQKPSVNSKQIGGVYQGEKVPILGIFKYSEEDIWYLVIDKEDNIGWAYRYLETSN